MLSSCWCWYGENSISLSLGSISFQKFISAQLTSRQHLHAQESPYVLHWLLNASPTLDQQHKVFTAYLPSKTSNKILKGPARSAVGQYGVLVLLSLSHIYHSYLVGLSAETVPHSVTTYQIFCSPFNQPCVPHLSCCVSAESETEPHFCCTYRSFLLDSQPPISYLSHGTLNWNSPTFCHHLWKLYVEQNRVSVFQSFSHGCNSYLVNLSAGTVPHPVTPNKALHCAKWSFCVPIFQPCVWQLPCESLSWNSSTFCHP